MSLVFSRRVFVIALAALGCRARPALPELGKVPPFALTDQAGKPVSRESFSGMPWVAAFMFTRCPTVCPRITARMLELQQRARQRNLALRLVSFSVDPEHDTPEVLREYAQKAGVDLGNWSFLTGDSQTVSQTAVTGFKMALEGKADPNAPDFGILHGSHLVLVDGESNLRGFYRSDEESEIGRLLDDAARIA